MGLAFLLAENNILEGAFQGALRGAIIGGVLGGLAGAGIWGFRRLTQRSANSEGSQKATSPEQK